MDTKLKNSRRARTVLAIIAVLLVTIANLCIFPIIGQKAEESYAKAQKIQYYDNGDFDIDYETMQYLWWGSYVLYYEQAGFTSDHSVYEYAVRSIMQDWSNGFEYYRNGLDYYVEYDDNNASNTTRSVGLLLPGQGVTDMELMSLQENYQCYFTLNYDETGNLSVENVWSREGYEDDIVKVLLQAGRLGSYEAWEKDYLISGWGEEDIHQVPGYEAVYQEDGEGYLTVNSSGYVPKNFRVVYAIPYTMNIASYAHWDMDYWQRLHYYAVNGSGVLYAASLAALLLMMLLLSSNRIWRGTVDHHRKRWYYLMEAAIIGIIYVVSIGREFLMSNIYYVKLYRFQSVPDILTNRSLEEVAEFLELAGIWGLIYGIWYLSLLFIRPVFSLGIKGYVKEYSLLYFLCDKVISRGKRFRKKMKYEVSHIDFSDKSIRTIRKVVIGNFLLLSLLSFLWFFGIIALAIYSFALFILIKRQYDKIKEDYQSLLEATSQIAQGNLQSTDERDWGVFEPFKGELEKICQGFSKAVEEEVKSQRMKTELITNVSHDLKTPLTAITTYVELLKDEDITPEQRASYVEVLERKSLRLKVLVEDLFEVSKASSNTMKLDLMEVDVANLLKQVSVEHEDRFAELGLSLIWKIPEEKVTRMLDNQKTYRIFENLFANIEKYAMPHSRVYIEVSKEQEHLSVVLKNMSAQELSVSGEEITERFVRGDRSRTTEGSGLGLAIAKSFTEAQKGEFKVTVDGDLFKVSILF